MKEINLYLDDKRVPSMSHNNGLGLGHAYSDKSKWTIVRDYFKFVDLVEKDFDKIKLVSFDHDLACFKKIKGVREEFTGKTSADYLIDYCLKHNKKFPNWYVHTDNISGRGNIIGAILHYLRVIEKVDISDFRYYHRGIINGEKV